MSALNDLVHEYIDSFEGSDWNPDDIADAFRDVVATRFPPTTAPEDTLGTGLYRDLVVVEILSSTVDSSGDWDHRILEPHLDSEASLSTLSHERTEVTRSQMGDLLQAQGSDRSFLGPVCSVRGCDEEPEDVEDLCRTHQKKES